eukprot:4204825-Pyramimonas_sp.AAC.1
MRPTSFPDWLVPGTSTYRWVATHQVGNRGSPMVHHLAWKAALGSTVPVDHPIVSMHREFPKIMQVAQSCDQLDGSGQSPAKSGTQTSWSPRGCSAATATSSFSSRRCSPPESP